VDATCGSWAVVGLISLSGQINSLPRVPLPAGGTVTRVTPPAQDF
jgi:hypothetical protein